MVRTLPAAVALAALLGSACGGGEREPDPPPPRASPTRVSGANPFPAFCTAVTPGVRYPGSEVEPSLAVNPADPDHLVAAWQQDRWSNGGADGLAAAVSRDGGVTWSAPAPIPFSRCGGGEGRGGDYQRATDPWVSFSADGALVHVIGLAFDRTTARKAIVASRSADGGLTWADPVALATDTSAGFGLDKPTLTADPADAQRVYAVWDRLTGLGGDPAQITGPAWFASSSDGGATWGGATVLHDPGPDAQTISSQLVVLPGGALVNVFVRITGLAGASASFEVMASRSADRGQSWLAPVLVAALRARGAADPETGHAIRAGEVVPSSAVDAAGVVWVAWEDARFSGGARDGIALSRSEDGGATWSAPRQVNGAPEVLAFRPAVAAGAGGVAVTYYDLRDDAGAAARGSWTTFWRATSTDGGATWTDAPGGGPFDLRLAPDAEGWFLGDYTGLVARGGGFVALFGMSGASTDLFVSR